jgi:hypothetical protein
VPETVTAATTRAASTRALAVLEDAARNGEPFAAEHAALSALLQGNTALSGIAAFTVPGVPALSKLRTDFDARAARAL